MKSLLDWGLLLNQGNKMFVGNDRKIKMFKDTLLAKLEKNLLIHEEEVSLATQLWKDAASDFCFDLRVRIGEGDYTNMSFDVPRPVDNSKEINRAIAMVTYSTEEEITLDEATFNQWVLNEWSFRNRLAEIGLMASSLSGSLRKK